MSGGRADAAQAGRQRELMGMDGDADTLIEAGPSSRSQQFQTRLPASSRSSSTPRRRRYLASIPILPILLVALISLLAPVTAAPSCLRFADYDSINALFTSGGPGTKVLLCPGKVYRLSGAIIFTAADQELATAGYPTDSTRAVLRVQGHAKTAIQGDCRRCKGVQVRSIVVDGNRKKLGRAKPDEDGPGLVVLGGNEGQVVRDCLLKDPRGFTALHIREGDKLQCKGATVINNYIGPVGDEYDPAKDGEDPETSPLGRPLADGVTVACRDSIVRDNTFVDNTDAAIVLYCAPGTIVENNRISTSTKSAIAGVLLVDATPFDGDYTGVQVRQNTIHAESAPIRIGIGMGAAVLSDDTDTVIRGAIVRGNTIKGDYLSYGITAAGLEDWTIDGNVFNGVFSGAPSDRCFSEVPMPAPAKMVVHRDTVKGNIQDGYVNEGFQYIACIDPLPAKGQAKAPVDTPTKPDTEPKPAAVKPEATPVEERRDAQKPLNPPPHPHPHPHQEGKPITDTVKTGDESAKKGEAEHASGHDAEESPNFFDTGSSMLDDIMEHSLARVLEVVEALEIKVEAKRRGGQALGKGAKGKLGSTNDESGSLADVAGRIVALERSQSGVLDLAKQMRSTVQQWGKDAAQADSLRSDSLNLIYSHLIHHFILHPELEGSELREPPPGWPLPPIPLGATKEYKAAEKARIAAEDLLFKAAREERIRLGLERAPWGWFTWLGLITGVLAILMYAVRFVTARRAGARRGGGGVLGGHGMNGHADMGHLNGNAGPPLSGNGQGHSGGYAPTQTHAHSRRRANSLDPSRGGGRAGGMVSWGAWKEWWSGGHRKVV